MTTEQRFYVVEDTDPARDGPVVERLVQASNPAQAIRHCAKRYNAKAAKPADIARLMSAGTIIERAAE